MQTRQILFTAPGSVEVRQLPLEDAPAPSRALVRNEASLVSTGTELANLWNVRGDTTYPAATGYASVGVVEQCGAEVTEFRPGDRVIFAGKHASRQWAVHGGNHPWGRLYPVPAGVAPADAVFVWLMRISATAVRVAPSRLGDTVAIFGLGLIGNLAAQLYHAAGARVLAFDPVAARRETARAVGLTEVFDSPPEAQRGAVLAATGGEGAEITVDAVGHVSVLRTCVEAARPFGTVVSLGSPRVNLGPDQSPDWFMIHDKELTVRSAHEWQFPGDDQRGARDSVPALHRLAFNLLAQGRVKVAPLCSHVMKPEDAPVAYRGLKEDPNVFRGVVFDWTGA